MQIHTRTTYATALTKRHTKRYANLRVESIFASICSSNASRCIVIRLFCEFDALAGSVRILSTQIWAPIVWSLGVLLVQQEEDVNIADELQIYHS